MSANDPTTPLSRDATMHRFDSDVWGGFTPGTVVANRYRIVALLGTGGAGAVYRADDLRLGQPVALKFIHASTDPRALDYLYHEVRVARQVSHPNVCRVHDVVEADGLRFIAMEYVDGEDLGSLLRRVGRLPPGKALEVARDIASGLAAAHDRGIVHRDLKPGNVMIDGNGRAHITDFGLASLAGIADGVIAGTPAYMAPEQLAGVPATTETDVYAFGLVVYEVITGERVYETPSFEERLSHRVQTPKPVADCIPDADPLLGHLVAACLEPEAQRRPPSARALLARLPGGDALEAAVAAGDTPSPEMVAAAAERGKLPAHVAWPLFGAIVLALPLLAWQSRFYLFNTVRKPPEVLADRAAGLVALTGETTLTRDDEWFFEYDTEHLRSHWGRMPREVVAAQRPGLVKFIYRRSPARMIPKQIASTVSNVFTFQSGHVTLDDPPLVTAGEATVVLDQNGALTEYRARPSMRTADTPDWRPLLEATGIDLSTLQPTQPRATPPVASDGRAAWTALYPNQTATAVRIEAASLFGRPAWLAVYGPWHKIDQPPPKTGFTGIAGLLQLAIMLGGFVAAVLVALRSVRRGRSDRLGAARVAFYVAAGLFLSWLFAAHHANVPEEEARMLSLGLGGALSGGVILWLAYLALEPSVRRRWPRSLIGWTRLLAGQLRDPIIGRDILIGIAGSIVWFQVLWGWPLLLELLDGVPRHGVHIYVLAPTRHFISYMFMEHMDAIQIPIAALFIYLLTTVIFRRAWLANAAWVLFAIGATWTMQGAALVMVLLLYVLLRYGLLTASTMYFVVSVLFDSPLTLDTNVWFFTRGAIVLGLVAAAAAWAARRATAGP